MGRLIAGSSLNGGFMKITYIHHSAFLAETEHACLLFDYSKAVCQSFRKGNGFIYLPVTAIPTIFPK